MLCSLWATTPWCRWWQWERRPDIAPLLQPHRAQAWGRGTGQHLGECLTPSPHTHAETIPTPCQNPSVYAEPAAYHGFISGARPHGSAALCLRGRRTGQVPGVQCPEGRRCPQAGAQQARAALGPAHTDHINCRHTAESAPRFQCIFITGRQPVSPPCDSTSRAC